MKKKINGLTAGGLSRSEILPGDIYQDNYGERVTIKMVMPNRIVFTREGYTGECFCPAARFEREYLPVKKQTFGEWCRASNPAEKIQKLREIIATRGRNK